MSLVAARAKNIQIEFLSKFSYIYILFLLFAMQSSFRSCYHLSTLNLRGLSFLKLFFYSEKN